MANKLPLIKPLVDSTDLKTFSICRNVHFRNHPLHVLFIRTYVISLVYLWDVLVHEILNRDFTEYSLYMY